MDISGVLGIFGFVFAVTTTGALVYEHQTDVLHGPFIEGRMPARAFAAMFDPVRAALDDAMEHVAWKVGGLMDHLAWHIDDLKQRIVWKVRNAVYLAMMA
jgi:hypothetical protein